MTLLIILLLDKARSFHFTLPILLDKARSFHFTLYAATAKKQIFAGDRGGSIPEMAGGSVANTVRGLSVGFGVETGIIGAYGDNVQGQFFVINMGFSSVSISRLRKKKGSTGQCVCLVDDSGNRTMRPCLSSAVKIQADELSKEDFTGS